MYNCCFASILAVQCLCNIYIYMYLHLHLYLLRYIGPCFCSSEGPLRPGAIGRLSTLPILKANSVSTNSIHRSTMVAVACRLKLCDARK